MTRTEGNVIHADFGHRERGEPLFDMAVSCRLLYQDEYVALARITYRAGDRVWVQHVCQGVGIEL